MRGDTLVSLDTIVWDTATGKQRLVLDGDVSGRCLALSPDGKLVAVGLGDGKVQLADLGTGRTLRTFGSHDPYVGAVAFSADGRILACANGAKRFWDNDAPGVITLWDVATLLKGTK
jgi:WD40 repeat protein